MRIRKSVRFGIIGLVAPGASLAFAGVNSASQGKKNDTARCPGPGSAWNKPG